MLPLNLIGLLMGALSAWVLTQGLATLSVATASLNAVANPAVTAPWFVSRYDFLAHIAAVLAVPLLFLAAIHALRRQDVRVLFRALAAVPFAALFTQQAVGGVVLLTSLVDAFSRSMLQGSTGTILGSVAILSSRLAPDATLGATGGMASSILVLLAGSMIALGAVALWVELLLRGLTIDVAVLFLPIAFVGMIWAPTEVWIRRLGTLILGLICAKLVIAAVLDLGIGAFATAASNPLSAVFTGGTLLMLATFAPWGLLRLIPFAQEAAFMLNEQRTQVRAAASRLHLPDLGHAGTDLLRARIAQAALDDPFPLGTTVSGANTTGFDAHGVAAEGTDAAGETTDWEHANGATAPGVSGARGAAPPDPPSPAAERTQGGLDDSDQEQDEGQQPHGAAAVDGADPHKGSALDASSSDGLGTAQNHRRSGPAPQPPLPGDDEQSLATSPTPGSPLPATNDAAAAEAASVQSVSQRMIPDTQDAHSPVTGGGVGERHVSLLDGESPHADGFAPGGASTEGEPYGSESLADAVVSLPDEQGAVVSPPWGDGAQPAQAHGDGALGDGSPSDNDALTAPIAGAPETGTSARHRTPGRSTHVPHRPTPPRSFVAPWGDLSPADLPAGVTPEEQLDSPTPERIVVPRSEGNGESSTWRPAPQGWAAAGGRPEEGESQSE